MNKFTKNVLTFCCVIALSEGFVAAQTDTKTSKTESAGEPTQVPTRARRVSAVKNEEPATAQPSKKDPQTEQEGVDLPPPAKMSLRDQIAAAASDQEKVRLQFQLVDELLASGAKQNAINELRGMTAEERFDPPGFYNIGNALARIGDPDGAISAYRKAIDQKNGRYSRALNNLGVILLRQGHWDEAYDAFTSALRVEDFRYAEASYNLGRLYAARGENDLAAREWRRAIKINPEHVAARQALAGLGKEERIAVVVPSRRTTDPPAKHPEPVSPGPNTAAPVSPAPKPLSPVRPSASRVLSLDPDTYDLLQHARTARERDHQQQAVADYRRVISRMGGYFPPANLELGYTLINLKQPDEALNSLLAVVKNDGARYPLSYYHVGRLYEARGDLKMAEESFTQAVAFYGKDNAQFLLDLSRVREKLGNYQGALTALEEYLAIMAGKNLKPAWSEDRVASLREKTVAHPKP